MEPEIELSPEEYIEWCKQYYADKKATKKARWKYVNSLAKQYPQGVPASVIKSAREMFKDTDLNFAQELQTLLTGDSVKSQAGEHERIS